MHLSKVENYLNNMGVKKIVVSSLNHNYCQMAKQFPKNFRVEMFFNGSTLNTLNYLPKIE
jgi:hypothetical protein